MKRKEIILLPMIFQFHKGTIRTIYKKRWLPLGIGFQFHKGTIRTDRTVLDSQPPCISIP